MPDALTAVRSATRALHEALDGSDWFARATANVDAYAEHLALLAAFYAAAEGALASFSADLAAAGFEPRARDKRAAIAAERATLPPVMVDPSAAGQFPALPDLSAALGCMYVLEGSTLGGVMLATRIREKLKRDSRFYGIYGARTGPMWRAFTTSLARLDETIDVPSLVAAAVAVFDTYAHDVAGLRTAPDRQ